MAPLMFPTNSQASGPNAGAQKTAAPPDWTGVLPEMTQRQAKAALIAEFIYAIKHRPRDFRNDSAPISVVIDTLTGQKWWIASGLMFFRLWRPHPEVNFSLWQRVRAWWAYRRWVRHFGPNAPSETIGQDITRHMMTLRDKNRP